MITITSSMRNAMDMTEIMIDMTDVIDITRTTITEKKIMIMAKVMVMTEIMTEVMDMIKDINIVKTDMIHLS